MAKEDTYKIIIKGENLDDVSEQLEQLKRKGEITIEKNHWTWLMSKAKGLLALGFFFMLILFVCEKYNSFEKSDRVEMPNFLDVPFDND